MLSTPFTHVRAGRFTMRLKPCDVSFMHGRDGIMMHGDNDEQNHSASDGCLIAPYVGRVAVSHLAGDRMIVVVHTEQDYKNAVAGTLTVNKPLELDVPSFLKDQAHEPLPEPTADELNAVELTAIPSGNA